MFLAGDDLSHIIVCSFENGLCCAGVLRLIPVFEKEQTHPVNRSIFFGWYVVIACFFIAMYAWGFGFYGHGIYLTQLHERHGWSAAMISTATTMYYLASAALLPFLGAALLRIGVQRTVLIGALAMAAGVVSLSIINAPWHLFAAYLLMACGFATMGSAAIPLLIAPWFIRRRGWAVSLAFNGASAGGMVVAPLMLWLIATLGFDTALWVSVGAMLAVLIPLTCVCLRGDPASHGTWPDGEALACTSPAKRAEPNAPAPRTRQLLSSLQFWSIAAPFALGLLAQVGFLTHQIPFLEPRLGIAGAGVAVALTTTGALVARIGFGFFIDQVNQRHAASFSLSSQALALTLLLFVESPLAMYGACVLFGCSVGNLIMFPALIIQREYPAAMFATVVGMVTATTQVAFAFGPSLLGVLRDICGDYSSALVSCIAAELIGAIIVLRRPAPP